MFCYEYHFWINQYFDVGGMYFSRRISEDIKSMVRAGIEGLIEDGSQRSFFPNGLGFYVYGNTLFDLDADVDELTCDYFKHAYGEHADFAYHYLKTITDLFEFAYMKGEATTDRANGKFYDPARVERMKSIITVAENAKKYAEEHTKSDMRVQTVSMQLLAHHADFCTGLARCMIPKCEGKHDEAQTMFRAFFEEFGKREVEIERYYDQYMCVSAMRKIFEEQFQTGITQIIG